MGELPRDRTFSGFIRTQGITKKKSSFRKHKVSADNDLDGADGQDEKPKYFPLYYHPPRLIYKALPKEEILEDVRKKRKNRKPTLPETVRDFHTPLHRNHHQSSVERENPEDFYPHGHRNVQGQQELNEKRANHPVQTSIQPDDAEQQSKVTIFKDEMANDEILDQRAKAEVVASDLAGEIIRGYFKSVVQAKVNSEEIIQEILKNDENNPIGAGTPTIYHQEDDELPPAVARPSTHSILRQKSREGDELKPKKGVRINKEAQYRNVYVGTDDAQNCDIVEDKAILRKTTSSESPLGVPVNKHKSRRKEQSVFQKKSTRDQKHSKSRTQNPVLEAESSEIISDGQSLGPEDSIYHPPTLLPVSEDPSAASNNEDSEDDGERPEWASDPKEFTKTGTPMPFWYYEMRKGTEYICKLHRKYGQRKKHERVPVYKPDMEIVSIDTKASDEGLFLTDDQEMYHEGLKHLIPLDRVFLFHRVVINDAILFCCNKVQQDYHILNHHGHFLYRVEEHEKRCGNSIFVFVDHEEHKVVRIEPMPMAMEGKRRYSIYCPPENLIGFIVQMWTGCWGPPKLSIFDENHTEIIKFDRIAPRFKQRKNPDLIFEYQSVRGQGPLGNISTKLADLKMANFTENDYYGIRISEVLPPNIKVRIMAAWFVIYGLFYKGKTYKEIHHNLTAGAERLYLDRMPYTEEIPKNLEGGLEANDGKPDED